MERRRKVSRCVQLRIIYYLELILAFVRRSGESSPRQYITSSFVMWYAENTSEMSDQDQVIQETFQDQQQQYNINTTT